MLMRGTLHTSIFSPQMVVLADYGVVLGTMEADVFFKAFQTCSRYIITIQMVEHIWMDIVSIVFS